jgi:hypothetical protein
LYEVIRYKFPTDNQPLLVVSGRQSTIGVIAAEGLVDRGAFVMTGVVSEALVDREAFEIRETVGEKDERSIWDVAEYQGNIRECGFENREQVSW